MSILLDALRKSEKDQQRVEAPGIHSVEQHEPTSGFPKKGWVLLLIVVLFTGASYGWYQYQKPDDTSQPPDALTSDPGNIDNKQSVEPADDEDTGDRLAMVAGDVTNRQRTPVEAYQQPADKTKPLKPTNQVTRAAKGGSNKSAAKKPAAKKSAAKKPAANKAAVNKPANNKAAVNKAAANKAAAKKAAAKKAAAKRATANKAAAKKAAAKKAAAKRATAKKAAAKRAAAKRAAAKKAAANKPAANKPAANKPAANKAAANKAAANRAAANRAAANKAAAKKPVTANAAAAGQKKFRPQLPAPINYWELPDSIRAKVPEMKFTVLVYAQEPADRFVLIDGQRFGEGDKVQPELVVKEIQRQGVVFKYRLYQFLVER